MDEEEKEEPIMEKAPAKKKAPAKEKVPATKKKAVTPFGHRCNSKAGEIDLVLLTEKAYTLKQIADKLEISSSRVLGHIKHLRKDKAVSIKEVKDTYQIEQEVLQSMVS